MEGITQKSNELQLEFNHLDTCRLEDIYIKSSNEELNNIFNGGLHKGIITQVYGEAGSGKSQMAMLFTLGAIERGNLVIYLSTEKQLSWKRFTTLAYSFMNQAEYEEKQKNLIYKRTSDFNQGYLFIEEKMKLIKEHAKGGLLVIDSIHTFMSSCFEFHHVENDHYQRSKRQAEVINRLRWLAKMSGTAVLVINHAADSIDKRRSEMMGRTIVPALGPSWELHIDESISLHKKGEVRQMTVINSPKCQSGLKNRFRIANQGFIWVSEEGVEY